MYWDCVRTVHRSYFVLSFLLFLCFVWSFHLFKEHIQYVSSSLVQAMNKLLNFWFFTFDGLLWISRRDFRVFYHLYICYVLNSSVFDSLLPFIESNYEQIHDTDIPKQIQFDGTDIHNYTTTKNTVKLQTEEFINNKCSSVFFSANIHTHYTNLSFFHIFHFGTT